VPSYIDPRGYAYSSLDRVIDNAIDEFYGAGALYLTDAVQVGVHDAGTRALQMMKAFAAALDKTTQSSRSQLTDVHYQLAREAQAATLIAYRRARGTGRMAGPYRLSQRDAGGKMDAAIESEEFIRATYDGIGFANNDVLDRMARQWHRLNYGAGEAAGAGPRQFTVHWGSAITASFGLTDTPSSGFMLPRGFWRDPSGKFLSRGEAGWFYPNRKGPGPTPTRGIRAWNFLDAGIESIANNIGPAYEGLYKDWFESAARGVGPLSRVEDIKVPAPKRLAFSVSAL
jgi:hypothetical protein